MSESSVGALLQPVSRCRYQRSGDRVGSIEIGALIGAAHAAWFRKRVTPAPVVSWSSNTFALR